MTVAADPTSGPTLTGERVRLRPMTSADARHLVRWAADDDFAWSQWGRAGGRFADAAAADRDFIQRFDPPGARLFAIELLEDGRTVGFANYRELRQKAKSAEIGIGIGEKDLWSKGLGRDALRTLVRHLVDDIGLHRVALHVHAENDRAIAAYKACGFEVEGILRDAVMTDRGHYLDSVAMAYIHGRAAPAFDPRPIVLEGTHIRLEPLRMEHAAELYRALADPEVWTWVGDPAPRGPDDVGRYIRTALDAQIRGEQMPWLTRRRSDGAALGTTRYGAISRPDRSLEIGWTMLGAAGRRTPANTEAKYLQLCHAFDELGAIRVWLKTHAKNDRSQRAIERIGATREGLIRNERIRPWDGQVRDAVYYSIVDREWPDVKRRLLGLLDRNGA